MRLPIFIGDELTGAGFRLGGVRVLEAVPDTVESVFRRALDEAPLVIVTAEVAGDLPAQLVEEAVALATPPVAIVPAASGGPPLPDMEREVRAALGVET
jgi:vacuolar-type H+-ATPase subunit F/Vma7